MKEDDLFLCKFGQMSRSRAYSAAAKGRGGSSGPANTEVATYITGLTTALSDAQVVLLDTFVTSLKTGLSITNLSDAFDVMYILAGETEESSLKNLVKNANHSTAVNSPAFVAYEGFTGDGTTSYINTNYNAKTQGVNYTLNNCSVGVYIRTDVNQAASDLGVREVSGGDNDLICVSRVSNEVIIRLNTITSGIRNANTDSRGMYIGTRDTNAISDLDGYKNSSSLAGKDITGSGVTTLVPNGNVFICARNLIGTGATSFSTKQVAFAFIGKHFTSANATVITNAIEAYMDANGKGVIA